jgi:hypothetical protein
MNGSDPRSENKINHKKAYCRPVVTVYGPVAKLTQGAVGSNPDGGNTMSGNMGNVM